MDEVADAPGVTGGGIFFPFQSPAQHLAETRIKDVIELSPIALRAFQVSGTVADCCHIRCFAHEVDFRVRPVGDSVEAPAFQSSVGDIGEFLLPIRAVFAQEVCLAEVVGSVW